MAAAAPPPPPPPLVALAEAGQATARRAEPSTPARGGGAPPAAGSICVWGAPLRGARHRGPWSPDRLVERRCCERRADGQKRKPVCTRTRQGAHRVYKLSAKLAAAGRTGRELRFLVLGSSAADSRVTTVSYACGSARVGISKSQTRYTDALDPPLLRAPAVPRRTPFVPWSARLPPPGRRGAVPPVAHAPGAPPRFRRLGSERGQPRPPFRHDVSVTAAGGEAGAGSAGPRLTGQTPRRGDGVPFHPPRAWGGRAPGAAAAAVPTRCRSPETQSRPVAVPPVPSPCLAGAPPSPPACVVPPIPPLASCPLPPCPTPRGRPSRPTSPPPPRGRGRVAARGVPPPLWALGRRVVHLLRRLHRRHPPRQQPRRPRLARRLRRRRPPGRRRGRHRWRRRAPAAGAVEPGGGGCARGARRAARHDAPGARGGAKNTRAGGPEPAVGVGDRRRAGGGGQEGGPHVQAAAEIQAATKQWRLVKGSGGHEGGRRGGCASAAHLKAAPATFLYQLPVSAVRLCDAHTTPPPAPAAPTAADARTPRPRASRLRSKRKRQLYTSGGGRRRRCGRPCRRATARAAHPPCPGSGTRPAGAPPPCPPLPPRTPTPVELVRHPPRPLPSNGGPLAVALAVPPTALGAAGRRGAPPTGGTKSEPPTSDSAPTTSVACTPSITCAWAARRSSDDADERAWAANSASRRSRATARRRAASMTAAAGPALGVNDGGGRGGGGGRAGGRLPRGGSGNGGRSGHLERRQPVQRGGGARVGGGQPRRRVDGHGTRPGAPRGGGRWEYRRDRRRNSGAGGGSVAVTGRTGGSRRRGRRRRTAQAAGAEEHVGEAGRGRRRCRGRPGRRCQRHKRGGAGRCHRGSGGGDSECAARGGVGAPPPPAAPSAPPPGGPAPSRYGASSVCANASASSRRPARTSSTNLTHNSRTARRGDEGRRAGWRADTPATASSMRPSTTAVKAASRSAKAAISDASNGPRGRARRTNVHQVLEDDARHRLEGSRQLRGGGGRERGRPPPRHVRLNVKEVAAGARHRRIKRQGRQLGSALAHRRRRRGALQPRLVRRPKVGHRHLPLGPHADGREEFPRDASKRNAKALAILGKRDAAVGQIPQTPNRVARGVGRSIDGADARPRKRVSVVRVVGPRAGLPAGEARQLDVPRREANSNESRRARRLHIHLIVVKRGAAFRHRHVRPHRRGVRVGEPGAGVRCHQPVVGNGHGFTRIRGGPPCRRAGGGGAEGGAVGATHPTLTQAGGGGTGTAVATAIAAVGGPASVAIGGAIGSGGAGLGIPTARLRVHDVEQIPRRLVSGTQREGSWAKVRLGQQAHDLDSAHKATPKNCTRSFTSMLTIACDNVEERRHYSDSRNDSEPRIMQLFAPKRHSR
ncbi:hypothetical protein BU14_0442s0004 [Porphyra umbilicalis]|uniref:Uncharacterized protein n=1 Tax=Porphyra umbilicalis TaxID=2786 RepID=A0A1X6NUS2_PORUM|nr:hypothetical protein BU14_0442s0004 [Porphyra umbilicalis]|eukprot:OSX72369.1 hypothetical protein BU14_0442s0004 [Porphyra umbilicalis]